MGDQLKKKLAVWKFASCDGCQLSILDLEDELLLLADKIQIAYFPEASNTYEPGPYDISLVEGSITTEHDIARIQQIRKDSKFLITIGACATAGGIQALRNFADVREFTELVYANPQYIETLSHSKPISAYAAVDFQLRGCPINKYQLLELLSSYLHEKKPNIADESVCLDCKRQGTVCVIVAKKAACLGPVTHSGCHALCPGFGRACFGCYGPKESANTHSLSDRFIELGESKSDLLRLYRNFNAGAPAFQKQSQQHE